MDSTSAFNIIQSETDYWAIKPAINWCIDHYKSSVPVLIEMLVDTTYVGLASTNGLFFWGRPIEVRWQIVGCITYEFVYEDIYTVSGRASHILNKLTNEHFIVVKSSTSYAELQLYKNLWRSWFRRL